MEKAEPMPAAQQHFQTIGVEAPPGLRLFWALVMMGAVAVVAERLWLVRDLPLWLDETWTGSIVSEPSWRDFMREAWLDPNAPLSFILLRFWTEVAGNSNLALRVPSLVYTTAAAALPLLWRVPGLSAPARATWAALVFLWVPGILFSLEARAYPLLLLIGVAQAIAYARLLNAPSTRAATLWCSLAALAMLTHYFAVYIVALQGLAYLAHHGRTAFRTWPAALAFLPALAWILYHLPRLLHWAQPDIAWYSTVNWTNAWQIAAFAVGPVTPVFGPLLAVVIAAIYLKSHRTQERDEETQAASHLYWAVGTGIAALVLAAAVGVVRPTLSVRYLTPMVPLVLLGLVLLARRARCAHFGYLLLTSFFLLFALKPADLSRNLVERNASGYEEASEFLIAARPERLVFAADSPGSKAAELNSLARTGSFFLRRAGLDVETDALILNPAEDANIRLAARATGPRPAILWFYTAGNTAAASFPPRLHRDPRWKCIHRRGEAAGVVACAPRELVEPISPSRPTSR